MTDTDWRELFKRYIKAVLNDEGYTARECADPSWFEGDEEQRSAVWELFLEAYREEFPNSVAPRQRLRD